MYCRPDLRSYAAILFTQTQKLSAVYDSAEVVEDPRLHSCPYGSNGTQGTRKSLFLVLFYIYIGSGRESRPVLFPAGSQGLPLRYPFSQNHHAKLCGTCKLPMLRSFANRHPLAASADILALPLRKDRFCHLYPFPAKIARHIP